MRVPNLRSGIAQKKVPFHKRKKTRSHENRSKRTHTHTLPLCSVEKSVLQHPLWEKSVS
jgi:hypothetical protein